MKFNKKVFFAQQGGPMPEDPAMEQGAPEEGAVGPESAPAGPQGAPSPEQQLQQLAMDIAQQIGNPQAVMMLAQMLMQIAQQMAGGGQGAPAFQRQGGRLVRVRR